MEDRWSYYQNQAVNIKELEIQSLYYIDIVLPAYRVSIAQAKTSFSFFIEHHYENFIEEIVQELFTVIKYFEERTIEFNKLYNGFKELMEGHNGYKIFKNKAHVFEESLNRALSLVKQVFIQVETELLKLDKNILKKNGDKLWLN